MTQITFLFLIALIAAAYGSCSVSSSMVARSGAWQSSGVTNTIYDLSFTNTGSCTASSLTAQLSLGSCTIISTWNIDGTSGVVSFSPMNPGSSFPGAGLIIAGTCTPTISATVECTGCSSSSPTSAPTTASPTQAPTHAPTQAAPTQSAPTQAAPTQTPTQAAPTQSAPTQAAPTQAPTQSSTPSPTNPTNPSSSCTASATMTARAGASWNSGGATNTIYDISVINSGSCAVTSITARLSLGSCSVGNSIWNYDVSSNAITGFGSIPVNGVFSGAGMVLIGDNCAPTLSLTVSCSSCQSSPSNPTSAPSTAPSTSSPATSAPTSQPATSAPTSSPSNQAPTSSPTPTSPTQAPFEQATCKVMLVFDYVYWQNVSGSGMTVAQLEAQYADYFTDVDAFFRFWFNLHITVGWNYVETDAATAFETSLDPTMIYSVPLNELFGGAFANRQFGGSAQPDPNSGDVCFALLITGQPYFRNGFDSLASNAYGFHGDASVCSNTSTGYVQNDGNKLNSSALVKSLIQAVGFNFNAGNNDYYNEVNSTFGDYFYCNADNGPAKDRLLRGIPEAGEEEVQMQAATTTGPTYKYLDDQPFFSQCATQDVAASISEATCIWRGLSLPSAYVTFYSDVNYQGQAYTVYARMGTGTDHCYDVSNFWWRATSFQLHGSEGITVYSEESCRNGYWWYSDGDTFMNTSYPGEPGWVGSFYGKHVASFKFL